MRDYTYQDMLKMQEDAANRVREMKKRAAIITDEDSYYKKTSLPDEVRHISYPVELPESQQAANQNINNDTNENAVRKGLLDYLKNDYDSLLVLALLWILQDNGNCDRIISLVLLYLLL